MDHANDDLIVRSLLKQTSGDERLWLEEHLDVCRECRHALAEAAKTLAPHTPSPAAASDNDQPDAGAEPVPPGVTLFAPGTRVDRFTITGLIGMGGAGVVYRAVDPGLQREVALKLIRPTTSEKGTQSARTRLLQEARAMARLSHPNVVAIHDVGVHDDQVFVVMDLVEGKTLADWLRAGPRDWRAIVDIFVESGHGLVAAHAVGLVHRDFKPDNILMGDDERARVTDFGLARFTDPRTHSAADPPGGVPVDASALAAGASVPTLTNFAGTPAYMAPEQLLGRTIDQRTDQFSFCVSLYLALYGRHPFGLSLVRNVSFKDMADRVIAGELERPPSDTPVPAAVRAILVRGLQREPGQRYPSLSQLLDELERFGRVGARATQIRSRSRIVRAAAVVGLLLTGAIALVLSNHDARQWLIRISGDCGNGRVEPGEECDDGNGSDEDGCLRTCRFAKCGDGKVRAHVEECDDGNTADEDACSSRCLRCTAGDAAFAWPGTGSCYSRHDTPAPWADARAVCLRADGDLATLANTEEWLAVYDRLKSPDGKPAWIGLQADDGGRFAWVTEEPMTLKAGRDETINAPPGTCGLQIPDLAPSKDFNPAHVAAIACTTAAAALCERPGWIVRATDNHAYLVLAEPLAWPEARAACEARGGHLATIGDADEQSFLAAHTFGDLWLGASDQDEEGKFRWITGEPFSFHTFAPGEPDDDTVGNCLVLGRDRVWHDRECRRGRASLCEID